MESMAILYFNAEQYKESLFWLNKLVNKKQPGSWLNNYSVALKLSILAHYELENTDLLDSLIKSTERFLIKNKIYFDFDRLFITTLKKTMKKEDEKSQLQILTAFKREIIILNENSFEKLAFYYFDYLRWVENKIKILGR